MPPKIMTAPADKSQYFAWLDKHPHAYAREYKPRRTGVFKHKRATLTLIDGAQKAMNKAKDAIEKKGMFTIDTRNKFTNRLSKLLKDFIDSDALCQNYKVASKNLPTTYLLARSDDLTLWSQVLPARTRTSIHTTEALGVMGVYSGELDVTPYTREVATNRMIKEEPYELRTGDTKRIYPDEPDAPIEKDWVEHQNIFFDKKTITLHIYTKDMTTHPRRAYVADKTTVPETHSIKTYSTSKYANLKHQGGIIDIRTSITISESEDD